MSVFKVFKKNSFTTKEENLHLSSVSLSLLSYCFNATQLQHTLESFPLLPNPWVDPLAGWLHCEWCVYGEGFGPMHYSTQILIPLMALSALGLHVCTVCVSGCTWACLACVSVWVCVFASTLLQFMLPSVFHHVAYNTHYLSPSNIYLMPIVHLCSAYIMWICMRPEIIPVMASHSA